MRTTLAVLVAALAVAGGAGAAAVAGTGRPATVVYSTFGARHGSARPGQIVFGSEWGVRHLAWSAWGGGSARGHGQFFEARFPGQVSYRAGVALSEVRAHDGTRYFAAITVTGPGHPALRLTYHRAAAGYWQRWSRGR